jgi:hypothetical protein
MSDAQQPKAKTETHSVYFIRNEDGEKSDWMEIGVAFKNKNGGYSIHIDRVPYGGFPDKREKLRLVTTPRSGGGEG